MPRKGRAALEAEVSSLGCRHRELIIAGDLRFDTILLEKGDLVSDPVAGDLLSHDSESEGLSWQIIPLEIRAVDQCDCVRG